MTPDVIAIACEWERTWRIHPDLAGRLAVVGWRFLQETGRTLSVISGFRTLQEQQELERRGRPAADPSRSTHLTLPATGADVFIGAVPNGPLKATLGRIAFEEGLRWGGGSPIDPETALPIDWNHFDLGPRSS